MNEEEITRTLIKCLKENKWEIISYDFPQSGSGVVIHADWEKFHTKGGLDESFIPDIIATKNDIYLFFENKSYFDSNDFDKISEVRSSEKYSNGVNKVAPRAKKIFFGVGIPDKDKIVSQALENAHKVDFIIGITEEGFCKFLSNDNGISLSKP